jgi:hypothetical protein
VASIPVPITDKAEAQAHDIFNELPSGEELKKWNIYSPLEAPVGITLVNSIKYLCLQDWDKFDYAKAERVIPASKKLIAEFVLSAKQNNTGLLNIEFQDAKGTTAIRLTLDSIGELTAKAGARYKNIIKYLPDHAYKFSVTLNTDTRIYTVNIDGKNELTALFFAPVESIQRIVFKTGNTRLFPNANTSADQNYDLPQAGEQDAPAAFYIKSFTTKPF